MRKPVAAFSQFSKGEAAVRISQRHPLRGSFTLRVKKLVNGCASWIIGSRPVPVHHRLAPLPGRQERQFRYRTIRIRSRSFQKRAPMLNKAADHVSIEDVGIVCNWTDNSLSSF